MMVDIRRDAKAFKLECIKHKIAIGRAFPAVPNFARVSVGTHAGDAESSGRVPDCIGHRGFQGRLLIL